MDFTLFGGPLLERDGEVVLLSPLQGAMLAVLEAHGQRGVARGQILSLLWSEGTDPQLRRRLNQLVYSLNLRLGAERAIRFVDRHYTLEPERLRSDLALFLTSLRDQDPTLAVEIATRGFLSGIEWPPTSEMERWIQERDLRFRSDVRTLASARWSEAEQRGDWRMAEEAAEVLLRLGPDDESALRRLLQAKALMGRVREAEAAYSGYRDLARVMEPGWEPEEGTRALLIRLDEFAARGREVVALRSSSVRDDPPFVGRKTELTTLSAIVRRPPADHFRTVVVSGEGGIGKSRLVREALASAPFDGIRVLEGRCSEFEKNIPLSPLIRAISQDWVGCEIERIPTPWKELLQAHFPEFASEPTPASVHFAGAAEEVPRATCEAFLRLLQQLADPDPLLVFLDDIQWIDATSFSVLQYIRERWSGPGLLFVATVRLDEMERDALLPRWLAGDRNQSAESTTQLRLGPLATAEVRALMLSVLEEETSAEGVDDLRGRVSGFAELMGGHPLLALEYARHLADPKIGPDPRVDGLGVPDAVRETLQRRTAGLSTSARALLVSLSPSGKPLPASLLEEVSGIRGADFATALDESVDQKLLSVSPRGIEFRHGLIREAILQEFSEATRMAMHRAIGDALAATSDPALDLDISLHLLAAGEGRRAVPYVLRAARTTIDSGGWSEARLLLETALNAELTALERGEIQSLLGRVLVLCGEFGRAVESWGAAEANFMGELLYRPAISCRMQRLHALSLDPRTDRAALLMPVRSLRQEASAHSLHELAADCMGIEAAILDRLDRSEEVRALVAQASEIATELEGIAKLHFLLVSLIDTVYGDAGQASRLADTALALASNLGRPDLILRALNWQVIACYRMATLSTDVGISVLMRVSELVDGPGDIEHRFRVVVNVGVWQMEVGNVEAANITFRRADRMLQGLAAPHLRRTLVGNLGQLALENGENSKAASYFSQCMDPNAVASWDSHHWPAVAGLGLARLREGQLREARALHEELPAKPSSWTFDPFLWLVFDARIALANGTPLSSVVEALRAEEVRLRATHLTTWMRLRLFRIETSLRKGLRPAVDEVKELDEFLISRRIVTRRQELQAHLTRYAFPMATGGSRPST